MKQRWDKERLVPLFGIGDRWPYFAPKVEKVEDSAGHH